MKHDREHIKKVVRTGETPCRVADPLPRKETATMSRIRWHLPAILPLTLLGIFGILVASAPQTANAATSPTTTTTTTDPPNPGARKNLGYFVQWGVYQRGYHVKNIHTSGSAAK